ncbi:cytochrome c [uncultured Shimia sp.]|uniref:c-type cytochrome n=1 Tax=uncultured Shimia sp. TaxID=573152 RepID=UPI0026348B62|nr:cytochrome c [uncultured Shimia sp.]
MKKLVLVGAAALLAGLGAWALLAPGVPEGIPYEDSASVARGEDIYAETCASCHGDNLEGAENWRVPDDDGRLPAPPHDETGHTWHHPDQQLFQLTKLGPAAIVGQGYESNMPGYEGVLSDQDIWDVLAYIKSTWPRRIIEIHNQRNG